MTDIAELALRVDSSQARTATRDLDKFGKEGRSAEGAATKLGKTSKVAFGAMAAAAAAAAAAVLSLGTATRQALEFGSALSEVGTLIEGTAKQTAFLDDASKRLAATYGGTGTAQAKAFYQAISAGAGSVEEAAETLDAANRLAIGGVTDVTTAVGILSTAMNVYESSNLSAADASDAIFVAVKAGVTTVGELSSALGKVLPLAEKMGLTFDETAAATAALTKGGLSTAEAVTGLRASLAAVLGPTTQAADMAKDLGLNFNAAAIEAQGFAGFMADVVAKTGGSAEKMQALFGSVEAVGAALAFSGSAGESMAAILDDMAVKTGATSEAFNKMSEDMQQRLNVVMGELWGLTTSFGSALLTVLVPALEGAAGAMTLIAENADVFAISLGVLAASQIPAVVGGLVTLSAWLATSEGLFIAGAIAARGLSVAMNLIPGVALFTATVATVTLLTRTYRDGAAAAADFATAQGQILTQNVSLRIATDNYYASMTAGHLEAMRQQAEMQVALAKTLRDSAKNMLEWEIIKNSLLANIPLIGDRAAEATKAAQAALADMNADVIEAEARLDAARQAAENMGGSLVDAGDSANKLVHASGLINFDGAAAGAAELAKWLGISLSRALSLSATTPAMADEDLAMSQSVIPNSETRANQRAAVENFKNMQDALNKVGSAGSSAGGAISKGMRDADKAASKLADQIERTEFEADPIKKYNAELRDLNKLLDAGLSEGAYNKELQKLNDGLADSLPLVNDVASAFGDFVVGGLKDFKGFVSSILGSFKSMLVEMIATAARNRIVVGLGIGGGASGVAGAASAATGGGGSGTGLLGSIGGLGSAFASGFSNTIAATFGAGGGLMSGIASAGAQVGTALAGGSIASIGAAIGAVAPYAALAFGAFKLLKGAFSRTYASSGYYGTLTASGLQNGREDRHYKGSTFRSGKTTSVGISGDIQSSLSAAADHIRNGTIEMAQSLGLATDAVDRFGGVAFGYSHNAGQYSDDAMQEAMQGALRALAEGLARSVFNSGAYAKAGEAADVTLQRLASSLNGVNAIFAAMDRTLLQVSLTGAAAASRLVDAFGGLQNMAELTGAYYGNFYSEAERTARITRDLTQAFAEMGYELPTSRLEFRALVDSIDVTTQAGANLYASMIGMSGALSGILPAFDAVTDATRNLVRDLLNDADLAATSYAQRAAREGITMADAVRAAQDGDINSVRQYLRTAREGAGSDLEYRAIAARVLGQIGIDPAVTDVSGTAPPPVRDVQAERNDLLELGLSDLRAEMAGLREENRQLGLRADRYLKQIADLAEKNDRIGLPAQRDSA
jgi:TP901 family phage tail tape measure protein